MRIKARIDRALADYRRIAIWGAGSLAALAMEEWLSQDRVVSILDNDPSKLGKEFFGHLVMDPTGVDLSKYDAVVVCISAYLEAFEEIAKRDDTPPYFYVYELILDPRLPMNELSKLSIDYQRARNRNLALTLLSQPQFLAVVSYRVTRYLSHKAVMKPLFYIAMFFHYCICAFSAIELPYTVSAGPGLLFPHLGGTILNRDTVLGAFVSLYQFTTLGSDDTGATPRIGDFVTINAGAVVLGGAVIAGHSRIGANATVLGLKCEIANVLVGTPARSVRSQSVPALAERSRGHHKSASVA